VSPTALGAGGAGYIGSQTRKLLAMRGVRPVAFDGLSTGDALFVGVPLSRAISLSANYRAGLQRLARERGYSFRRTAYVGESVADPAKY
jgi:UDP-arabinose 4-epimerase